jgi:glyoxylase-like metal-dependent hydrolase (beta-lactamase superfamily II)
MRRVSTLRLRISLFTIVGALVAIALAAPGCLTLPMGSDRPELARFAAAAASAPAQPPAVLAPALQVVPLMMASKKQPACGLVGQDSCFHRIEMVHSAFLVRHPKATFLIDAGLSARVGDDLARFSWTQRVELGFTPLTHVAPLLAAAGAPRPDFVILTHVHWDHTSGLVDLPGVKVLTTPEDWAFVQAYPRDGAFVRPDHFAHATVDTFRWDGPPYENFPASHDLFGDGAVVLVPLPGHTPGALGVFLNGVAGRRVFFVGDTVWASDGVIIPSHRAKPLSHLADNDAGRVSDAIWRLHHLRERHPDLLIVPSHDGAAYRQLAAAIGARP